MVGSTGPRQPPRSHGCRNNNKKRSRESPSSEVPDQSAPPIKKTKSFSPNNDLETEPSANPVPSMKKLAINATSTAPAIVEGVSKTHQVTTMSIISSSKIQQKIIRIRDHLAIDPTTSPEKPHVVVLHARADVAWKAMAIALKIRGILEEAGAIWYSYAVLESLVQQSKSRKKDKGRDGAKDTTPEPEEDLSPEGSPFEKMVTPFERAMQGKVPITAWPVMHIYISRSPISVLRKDWAEQTNDPEIVVVTKK